MMLAAIESRTYLDVQKSEDHIYLFPYDYSRLGLHIKAVLARHTPISDQDGKHFASFTIGIHRHTDNDGFNLNITANSVPIQARDNMSTAKAWLSTCLSQHTNCQQFHLKTVHDPAQRPTRVLDISANNIRLLCNVSKQKFDYLTLSYMWGKNSTHQLRLVQSNLTSFEHSIPRADIETSSVYKEAIRVTLALGYRYLWIDSLCIIQDSPADWNHEAQRMAIVYGNAVCNLAFLFPANSPQAPDQRDDPRVWNPCVLRRASATRPGLHLAHANSELRLDFQNDDARQDWLVQRNWPLFARAWTFQEYVLSPRTLLLGHRHLMWHCSELFCDEMMGAIAESEESGDAKAKRGKDRRKTRYVPASLGAVGSAASLSAPQVLSFMADWQNVVNEYRGRQLSFAQDRVIAFAGIARAYTNIGGLTYLAGLWREILPLGLLWYLDRKPDVLVRREQNLPKGLLSRSIWTTELIEQVEHAAPSWSWFSVPIRRFYQTHFIFNNDEYFVRCKSNSNPELVCFDDIFWARTMSYQFAPEQANQFRDAGYVDFAGLRVTMQMQVLPVKVDWPSDLAAQIQRIRKAGVRTGDGHIDFSPVFEYFPDDITKAGGSPPKNGLLAMLAEFQIVRTAGKWTVQRRMAGLALAPASERETWKRVGAWRLNMRISGVDVKIGDAAAVGRRWRAHHIVSDKWQLESVVLV
ncbi:hypothetical protein ACN47E_001997 [Coniothyrium glycines]